MRVSWQSFESCDKPLDPFAFGVNTGDIERVSGHIDFVRLLRDDGFYILLTKVFFCLSGEGTFIMAVNLTPRQREVVRLLSLGCTVRETAKILGLAPSTVDNVKTAAMERMGTNKLALVTRLAIKHRLTSMKDQLTRTEKRKSGRKNDGWN